MDCTNGQHLDLRFQIKSVLSSGFVVRGGNPTRLVSTAQRPLRHRPLHYGGRHTTAKSMRVVEELIKVISPQFTESYYPTGSATCPTVQSDGENKKTQQESIHELLKLLPEEVLSFYFLKSEAFNLKGAAVFLRYFTCVPTASLLIYSFLFYFCPGCKYVSLYSCAADRSSGNNDATHQRTVAFLRKPSASSCLDFCCWQRSNPGIKD